MLCDEILIAFIGYFSQNVQTMTQKWTQQNTQTSVWFQMPRYCKEDYKFCMPNLISKLCWQLLACHLSAGYRLAAWLCSGQLSVGPACLCLHKITAFQFWPALKQTQTLFVCLPCGSPHITRQCRSFTLPSYLTLLSGRDRGHLGFITVSRSVSFWGDEVKNSNYSIIELCWWVWRR